MIVEEILMHFEAVFSCETKLILQALDVFQILTTAFGTPTINVLTTILAWEFVTRSCLKPQNPCSNQEIHMLLVHGFYLKRPKLGPDLYAWHYTGKPCGRD